MFPDLKRGLRKLVRLIKPGGGGVDRRIRPTHALECIVEMPYREQRLALVAAQLRRNRLAFFRFILCPCCDERSI